VRSSEYSAPPRKASISLEFFVGRVGNANSINFNLLILKTLKLALGAGLQHGGTNADPSLPDAIKAQKVFL
jgi:hypothetical protein